MTLVEGETARLQAFIDTFASDRSSLKVLEAGCGALTHIALPSEAYIVGIDISKDQLDRNENLKETIHGDIQCCDLPES